MALNIEVDDEVYAALQSLAVAFVDTPNSVLRRLLLSHTGEPVEEAEQTAINNPPGNMLGVLFAAGFIQENEQLIWSQQNERHRGWITSDGCLRLEDGTVHRTPSAAARHLSGYAINGWVAWRRVNDDESLADIRSEYLRRGASGSAGRDESGDSPSGSEKRHDPDSEPRTPQKEFRPFILEILQEKGGQARVDELLEELHARMIPLLLEGDYAILRGGEGQVVQRREVGAQGDGRRRTDRAVH